MREVSLATSRKFLATDYRTNGICCVGVGCRQVQLRCWQWGVDCGVWRVASGVSQQDLYICHASDRLMSPQKHKSIVQHRL
jgi:hypothetical protein